MQRLHHDAHAQAEGEAPGSLSPGETGYWLWYTSQPGLRGVPIGVYDHPPPDDPEGALGSIYLGNDEGTTVAGFRAGYLLWRTSRAEGWVRRHLADLVP